jgi:hypothetical protein
MRLSIPPSIPICGLLRYSGTHQLAAGANERDDHTRQVETENQ